MPNVGTQQVALDAAVLRSVDAAAERLGRSREEILEDSVRRGLAARTLGDVLARVRAGAPDDLTEEQASEIAYSEVKAARAERQARNEAEHRTSAPQ